MTDIRRPVNGAADAVRMLRLQPFRQLDKHALTSYCRNVQILIVCLRRTKPVDQVIRACSLSLGL